MSSKIAQNISAFISGELSPLLRGRTDLQRYQAGCEDITNMVVLPTGGLAKRPGIIHVAETKDSSASILIPFVYSQTVTYMLEFSNYCVRVFKEGAIVAITGTLTNEIVSPYPLSVVDELHYKQQADVLYITHQSYKPYQFVRFHENQWGFIPLHFQDGPYNDQNITETELAQEVAETGNTFDINGIACNAIDTDAAGGRKGLFNTCDTDDKLWTARGVAGTKTVNKIKYLNSLFIAIGNKGFCSSSPDGTTWTNRTNPSSGVATKHIYDIAFGGANLMYVGQDGLVRQGSSVTATWVTRTSGVTQDLRGAATYSGFDGVIAVGEGGTIVKILHNVSWGYVAVTSGVTIDFHAVAWCPGVGFIAVGKSGMIMRSANGTTAWTARVSNVSVNLNDIFVVGSTIYVVGDQGYVLTSTDGVTWIINNLGRNYDWMCGCKSLKTGATTILIGGKEGIVARSTDANGTAWNIQNMKTVQFISTDSLFTQDDLGRKIRWQKEGSTEDWGWGNIIEVKSSVDILVDVHSTFNTTANSSTWRLGAFYEGNYPKCVEFYEQRLMLANTPSNPAGVWGSESGDYINFRPSSLSGTVSDNNAVSYSPPVTDEIKWLKSTSVLLLGYGNGIGRISGSGVDEGLTPTNVIFRVQCSDGTADIPPLLIGSSVLYVHSSRRKVRKLDYNDTLNVWESSDITIMSDHLGAKMIKSIAFQRIPFGILWCVCDDGEIIAATYEKDHEVIAWHKHAIAGDDIGSLAIIPTTSGEDEVWVTYCNTTMGELGIQHMIGYMNHFDNMYSPPYCYVDNAVLTAGVYTGIPYTGKALTVDLEMALRSGSVQGKLRRITQAMARLYFTGYLKLGYSSTKADVVYNGTVDGVTTLFSGDKQINFPSGFERQCKVYFESSDNTPLTVLSIVADTELA